MSRPAPVINHGEASAPAGNPAGGDGRVVVEHPPLTADQWLEQCRDRVAAYLGIPRERLSLSLDAELPPYSRSSEVAPGEDILGRLPDGGVVAWPASYRDVLEGRL